MANVGNNGMDGSLDSVELTRSQDTSGYRRYRDLPHRSFNETLRTHSNFAVKLSETGLQVYSLMTSLKEKRYYQVPCLPEL